MVADLNWELNEEIKKIKKYSNNSENRILNRLNSIYWDAQFIKDLYLNYLNERFPIVANERCGTWYIPSEINSKHSVYFKSTDGHIGIWNFSLKRLNLHLMDIISEHQGVIIVDSTQKGKSMPDSFSRTIPIYCSVINLCIKQILINSIQEQDIEKLKIWDTELYTPKNIVSDNEYHQIKNKIPSLCDKLRDSNVDLKMLSKKIKLPLRPIFITKDSNLFHNYQNNENDQFLNNVPFCPLILCSASTSITTTLINKFNIPFQYIKGAADDEESWSKKLTSTMFWKNYDLFLKCEKEIDIIKLISKLNLNSDIPFESNWLKNQNLFDFVGNTMVAIGGWKSGEPNSANGNFDVVINCSDKEYNDKHILKNYLFLNIKEGKLGAQQLLLSIEKVLDFLIKLNKKVKILCHCAQGRDRSVGIALSILLRFMNVDGTININLPKEKVSKEKLRDYLMMMTQYRPGIMPSRTTLKKVSEYFNHL